MGFLRIARAVSGAAIKLKRITGEVLHGMGSLSGKGYRIKKYWKIWLTMAALSVLVIVMALQILLGERFGQTQANRVIAGACSVIEGKIHL